MSWRRALVWTGLGLVLAAAFMGHLRPAFMMNWETLLMLCGLR